jgi:hypothetical protein
MAKSNKVDAKKSPAKQAKPEPKGATKSASTKTAAKLRHIAGADSHKTPGKKSAQAKNGKKPSSAQACWPGYEPTPGKAAGEKGSCQPKEHQTAAERKGDRKAAAAAKLSGQRA